MTRFLGGFVLESRGLNGRGTARRARTDLKQVQHDIE